MAAETPFDVSLCQLTPHDANAAPIKKAIQKKARAQLIVAKRAYDASDYSASIKALRESYELEPALDTLFNIAQACREVGAAAEAIPLYDFTQKNSEDDAIKADCQRHLATLRPQVAKQEDARAQDLFAANKFVEAGKEWEQAYKLDPQPRYLLRLGDAQRRNGQAAEAIALYERVIASGGIDDTTKEARTSLQKLRAEQAEERARKHVAAEEYAQAFAAWREVYELDPQPRHIFQIAEAARLAGLKRDAAASYQRFLHAAGPDELPQERRQAQSELAASRLQEKEDRRIAEGKKRPIYKKWWFWTALGGVAAAAAIVGGVVGTMAAPKSVRLSDLPGDNVVDL